ncbi:ribonuclease P protein component [Alicyclobacillus pomorum]|uniref:ribonuclease P protein component n=1 Tax=Alicyclobacillus pomorum TaxID=204470 RepID=UPI000424A051
MQSIYRLKENKDFRRVFTRGKSVAGGQFVLYWLENKRTPYFRVGFSVSKKVGNAVVRNRLKRRLRACFHELTPQLVETHMDFVVVCRKSAADTTYEEMRTELSRLLRKAKIMV